MKCPRCGMNMVRQQGDRIYLTHPAQWDERWWCKCGYATGWEGVCGKTPEENLQDEWDRANNINYGNTTLNQMKEMR